MKFYEIPSSLSSEIDELEILITRYREGGLEATSFRAHRVPFGIYEQRTPGTYMIRIRCTAGGITPGQFKTVALLSEKYGAETIHITTRQELQIHDVLLENAPAILRELLKAGLSTRGGGGNTVRNIMASWDAGVAQEEAFDVTPYAVSLTSMLIAENDSWTLPRKFKIAFSNSDKDNAHSAFNDLGFIASLKDGIKGFKVYVAGGMGAKPQTGQVLHQVIPADQVYRVAESVKRVFDGYGNRKNKHVARLRFLWNKLGEERFRELYEKEFNSLGEASLLNLKELKNEPENFPGEIVEENSEEFALWKTRFTVSQKQPGLSSILVPVTLGNLHCRQALILAELLAAFGENVLRFTMEQNLTIRNIPEKYLGNIYAVTKNISEFSSAPKFFSTCIACTGADTCKLGICLPRGALSAISRKLLKSRLNLDALSDLRLNISGCPNTCGAHMTADLGFYGQVGRKGQRIYPSYVIVAGARIGGETPGLAVRTENISARDLPDFVADFLKVYLEKQDRYGSFAEYIDDEGQQDIKNVCGKYREIPDFRDDKNYYFDWGADELFSLVGRGVGECSAGLFDLIEVDMKSIKDRQQDLEVMTDEAAIAETLYHITLSAARMLLVTRGVEARSDNEVFDTFVKYFIEFNLIDKRYLPLLEQAKKGRVEQAMREAVYDLARSVEKLYEGMDDSLKFQPEKDAAVESGGTGEGKATVKHEERAQVFKDLRGVACPMNFVKTKMELAKMGSGELLRILLDDGEPIDNVPHSVREEGHRIAEMTKTGDYWSVLIERN